MSSILLVIDGNNMAVRKTLSLCMSSTSYMLGKATDLAEIENFAHSSGMRSFYCIGNQANWLSDWFSHLAGCLVEGVTAGVVIGLSALWSGLIFDTSIRGWS